VRVAKFQVISLNNSKCGDEMRMNEVMILWCNVDNATACNTNVKAVIHGSDDSKLYKNLRKSMGACWDSWKYASGIHQATHLLAIFNIMVCDGVSVSEADSEFLCIDEYAEWKINGTGPFAEAYSAWNATENEADAE
jgi:hypothetical protein